MSKVYVAGPITGVEDFEIPFADMEEDLTEQGHKVFNPALMPGGFEQDEYMHVCYAMIGVCEVVCFLEGWEASKGSNLEHDYATKHGKVIWYEGGDDTWER